MNISGIFTVNLAGKDREIKANFALIEKLEGGILRKSISRTLEDAINGEVRISEMVSTIHAGLVTNNDTRLSREEVGAEFVANGASKYLPLFVELLAYLITGDRKEQATGEA